METQSCPLAPSQAVLLLEEAQCDDAFNVAASLHHLSLHLRAPHPTVTSAALDLLQVHPLSTIPHLASLISASPADVHAAVEAFSDLLSADRTLLVPIIAALSDLQLSSQHQLQTRATLRYALSVVDAHDLPAVVRAIARMCATAASAAAARWAARALRVALADPPKAEVIPVLMHVLEDVCRPGNIVGVALRKAAGKVRVIWLDIVVWLFALRCRTGPYGGPFREATVSVQEAVHTSLLAGDLDSLLVAIDSAREAVREAGETLRVFVRLVGDTIEDQKSGGLAESARFAKLLRAFVEACPSASEGIVAELLSPGLCAGSTCEVGVLAILEYLPPRARRRLASCPNVRLRVAVLMQEAGEESEESGSSVWSSVFVSVRKGLLFGVEAERRQAMEMAMEIVKRADAAVVKEMLEITDASVTEGLGDEMAIGVLDLVGCATMRGFVSAEVAARVVGKRIDRQDLYNLVCELRSGTVKSHDDDGRSHCPADSVGTVNLQIDVGLVWEQNPAAVASVTSSAAALSLACHPGSNLDNIGCNLLSSNVLIPVICIPLYQAVEDCEKDYTLSTIRAGPRRRPRTFEQKGASSQYTQAVRDINLSDLAIVIPSFIAGIASLIGLVNLSCRSLDLGQEIVLGLRNSGVRASNSINQRMVWALLERLTEFDRMLSALLLTYDILQEKSEGVLRKSSKVGSDAKRKDQSTFRRCEELRDAVVLSLSSSSDECDRRANDEAAQSVAFPRLSLNAIVCALAAVPDDTCIRDLQAACRSKRTRDVELSRIDNLLISQLVRCLLGSKPCSSVRRLEAAKRIQTSERSNKQSDGSGLEIASVANDTDASSFLTNIEHFLEQADDIFFVDDSDSDEESDGDLKTAKVRSAKNTFWATWKCKPCGGSTEYRLPGDILMSESRGRLRTQSMSTVHVIHSPAFAAILLDRAATYVATARSARLVGDQDHTLSSATLTAGFALSCLVSVLTEFLSLRKPSKLGDHVQNNKEALQNFLREVDGYLLSGLGDVEQMCAGQLLKAANKGGTKTVSVLYWISQTSIDPSVAAIALQATMVIAELNGLPMRDARQALLSSLTTVYEYDVGRLWNGEDLQLVSTSSFGEWCVRYRGFSANRDVGMLDTVAKTEDEIPWAFPHLKSSRKSIRAERFRIDMYFAGMNVAQVLQECRGWVRDLDIAMFDKGKPNTEAADGEVNKTRFRAEIAPDMVPSHNLKHPDNPSGGILLDMIGFENILETLGNIVQIGLESYPLPESFSVQDAVEVGRSPIRQIERALNLMRGILGLYTKTLSSQSADDSGTNSGQQNSRYKELEHIIVSMSMSTLQLTRAHLDRIANWYLNPTNDVSALSQPAIRSIEQVIGSTSHVVLQCGDVITVIKTRYSSYAEDTTGAPRNPSENGGVARKSPGFAQKKRKRVASSKEVDVTRARKLLPRLSSQCECVRKEAHKLARAMGIRPLRNLARLGPPPPSEDESVHIGVALKRPAWGCGDEADNSHEDAREGEGIGDSQLPAVCSKENANSDDTQAACIDEFHSSRLCDRQDTCIEPNTVTINFKRS